MSQLAPSILSADFTALGKAVETVEKAGADLIHVDVMDGHFVPNISFGAPVMKALAKTGEKPLDVHLMIEEPDRFLDDFVTPKTRYITVHQEACVHLDRVLESIRERGIGAGVAINPATPVSTIEPVLGICDLVLVMSVNPGFGGQKLIPYTLDKVRKLASLKVKEGFGFAIEIDGGITLDNVRMAVDAGCGIIVAGSAIFGAKDVSERVALFRERMAR